MYLAVEHVLFGRTAEAKPGVFRSVVGAVITFHLVCIAWVFFRAETFSKALWTLERMLTPSGMEIPTFGFERAPYVLISLALTAVAIIADRLNLSERVPRWAYAEGIAALVFTTIVGYGDSTEFIYFRF